MPGVTLTKWRRIWAERFPGTPLVVVEVAEAEQRRVLDDGTVDMCFVRLPVERAGLHAIPLYEEQPVAWLSRDHRLAGVEGFETADLEGENVVHAYDKESVELATYSAAILRVPLSIARTFNRKDLVHRLVTDAPATTVALAWPVAADNPLIEEFIGVVRGRTANSSRTAAERTGRATEPPAPRAAGRAGRATARPRRRR